MWGWDVGLGCGDGIWGCAMGCAMGHGVMLEFLERIKLVSISG